MTATETPIRRPTKATLRGLDGLNFFLADVRDGLGPYLAIYLIDVRGPDQGSNKATTGLVMTIAGLLSQTPAGALSTAARTSAPSWLSQRSRP